MNHCIKTIQPFFDDVYSGRKTFEVRVDDRNYQINDTLHLQEWDQAKSRLTGREITANVDYVLRDSFFCKEGFVIMSIAVYRGGERLGD